MARFFSRRHSASVASASVASALEASPLPADDDTMAEAWCATQLHWWGGRYLDKEALSRRYADLNASLGYVWIFRFKGDMVTVDKKPPLSDEQDSRASWLTPRVQAYLKFFTEVAKKYPFDSEFEILVDLEDNPTAQGVPIFSFQKGTQSDFILLPDVDIIMDDFYQSAAYKDNTDFYEKACRAVFVGSTSGSLHTVQSVKALSNPRIEAGVYFGGYNEVDFHLPNIVQCADDEAKETIKNLGFGREGRLISWYEQFSYKFLLSLDGNGATCSRVAIALGSNSVLMKYNSDRALHYFPSLIPWLHFIPISKHEDVLNIVRDEASGRSDYGYIANAGREFYKRYLNKGYSIIYVHSLLSKFAKLLDNSQLFGEIENVGETSERIITYSRAHVCNVGDVYLNDINPWIGRMGSRLPLEAFHFSVKNNQSFIDICYRVYSGVQPLEWCRAGDLAGTPGINNIIHGIEIEIGGSSADIIEGCLEVKFVDGSKRSNRGEDGCCKIVGAQAIECFRFELTWKA